MIDKLKVERLVQIVYDKNKDNVQQVIIEILEYNILFWEQVLQELNRKYNIETDNSTEYVITGLEHCKNFLLSPDKYTTGCDIKLMIDPETDYVTLWLVQPNKEDYLICQNFINFLYDNSYYKDYLTQMVEAIYESKEATVN